MTEPLDPAQLVLAVASGTAVLAAGVAGGMYLVRGGWRMLKKINRLLDDFLGDPDDPKQPGVIKRLEKIEGELSLNSGGSVKDKVNWLVDQMKAAR